MVLIVPLFNASTLKREILALSQELRLEYNVMDKNWYRNPSKSEIIGRCGGDEKTRMTTQNRNKSNAKKTNKKNNNTKSYHSITLLAETKLIFKENNEI